MRGSEKSLQTVRPEEGTLIRESLLALAADIIADRMGLYFPVGRRKDLEKGLRLAGPEFGFDEPEAFLAWLHSASLSRPQIEALAGFLTVGETYFFRDRTCFDFLEQQVFPELIAQRMTRGKYLRVWSAGCCTGEEPYSLAILLNKLMGKAADWNINLLATDINPLFLNKASARFYSKWSFRDTPQWVRQGYFLQSKNNHYELLPEIRKRVSFSYLNLAENVYPSPLTQTNAMDVILCRNVLMYMSPEQQKHIVRRLGRCLVEGGWLIVGPSEFAEALSTKFQSVKFGTATFYRKQDREALIIGRMMNSSIVPATASIHQKVKRSPPTMKAPSRPGPSNASFPPDGNPAAIPVYRTTIDLARSAADRGDFAEALANCEKAIAADRCEPAPYYLRATILQEQGRWREASADLEKALYLDPDFIPAHILLGNLTLRRGSKRVSSRHFRNALNLLSRHPEEEVITEAEGLTAGRLMELIRATQRIGDRGKTTVRYPVPFRGKERGAGSR